MENFDIEQLERKNIYKTPDNFFARMQENVLNQAIGAEIKPFTAVQPAAKTNNWWYAAAAAIVILFGLGAYFNINDDVRQVPEPEVAKVTQDPIRQTEVQVYQQTPILAVNGPVAVKLKVEEPKTGMVSAPNVKQQTKVATKAVIAKFTVPKTTETKIKTTVAPARVAEDILASLSKEEVALLANETQDDVYLDLYN